MRALLVDDHPDVLAVLSVYCQLAGWQTEQATTVAEARAALAEPFDAIFLDWHLQNQHSALDLVADMESQSGAIVLMSGQGSGELRVHQAAIAAQAILPKPFDRDGVAKVLAGLVPS